MNSLTRDVKSKPKKKIIEPHQLKEQIHPLPFQTHTLCQPVSYHAPKPLSEISRLENVKLTSLAIMKSYHVNWEMDSRAN